MQRKDPQFLHETPHIAEQLAAAHDHGQHPFAHIPDLAGIPPQPLRTAGTRALPSGERVGASPHPPTTGRLVAVTLVLMNSQVPDVVSLVEHVGSRLGDACGGVGLVADRRGSRVYRLRFLTGDVALKLASGAAALPDT